MSDFSREELLEMGVLNETIEAAKDEGIHWYKVTVMEDCNCAPCRSGKRWFYCDRTAERTIATYAAPGECGGPFPDAVSRLFEKYPGKVLLY